MTFDASLSAHLKTGATTVCTAWAILRRDGTVLGFTDHDRDLGFDGITFRAESGLTASALEQATGLAVDNSEAVGALDSAAITGADIAAGRYDGAEVRSWLVNWANVGERQLVFRGSLGEIQRAGGAFRAELRGLSEMLNQPMGRIYQGPCAAVLGDAACGVDTDAPGLSGEVALASVEDASTLWMPAMGSYAEGWFTRGTMRILDGAGAGQVVPVKRDVAEGGQRRIDLWTPLAIVPAPGDMLRLEAGCDKRFATCRAKFGNAVNYRGFPDIPGDDWIMVNPGRTGETAGGSRR